MSLLCSVMFGIYLSNVLHEYRASGLDGQARSFDVTYRKADGSFGLKKGVRRRAGQGIESDGPRLRDTQRHTQRASKLYLWDKDGNRLELWTCLLVAFNGKTIDHRF